MYGYDAEFWGKKFYLKIDGKSYAFFIYPARGDGLYPCAVLSEVDQSYFRNRRKKLKIMWAFYSRKNIKYFFNDEIFVELFNFMKKNNVKKVRITLDYYEDFPLEILE